MYACCEEITNAESYHQMIGCHIETIIGKDPEACILLVGSWWDKVKDNSVLKSKKGVNDLFVTAAEHIKDRMKHISESEGPKLITCPETKIFPLSNKAEPSQNGLTRWQRELSKVFHSILTHEDILPIQSNIPRFWESFNEEMKEKFDTYIEYHQAQDCFNDMVKNLTDGEKSRIDEVDRQEIRFVEILEKILTQFFIISHKGTDY